MTGPLVVISCGKAKTPHPAPAAEFYTGGYFRAQLGYARRLTTDDRILVLSAKYGLVPLHRELSPYDLRITQPGAVTTDQLVVQARSLGVARELQVVSLCGRDYGARVRAVWGRIVREPLAGLSGGMGTRLAWLRKEATA